jgi:hypothetical protein
VHPDKYNITHKKAGRAFKKHALLGSAVERYDRDQCRLVEAAGRNRLLDFTDRLCDLNITRAGNRTVEDRAATINAKLIVENLQAVGSAFVAAVENEAMRINGQNMLACKTLVQDLGTNLITVEPILGMPVLKDMIVNMEPFFNHYKSVMPYFVNDDPAPAQERLQTIEDRERFDDTTKCILCAL